MTPYAIAKDYDSPTTVIQKGVIKSEDEWIQVFPCLKPGDCAIKKAWFIPKPLEVKLEHIDPGDFVLVNPNAFPRNPYYYGDERETLCQISFVKSENDIEILCWGFLNPARIKISDIFEIVEKWHVVPRGVIRI